MIESSLEKVKKYLSDKNKTFAPVLEIPLTDKNVEVINLSKSAYINKNLNIKDYENFEKIIFKQINDSGARVGAGGYLEDRPMYNQSENFNGNERRTVHLGTDLWVEAGTVVYAPLEGYIHSFNNNKGFGNYGPTMILEHNTEQVTFYTLYGHLSESSLDFIKKGELIKQGTMLGRIGSALENGGWPPHLHFQIITDLDGNEGDFPGVAAASELEDYLKICPDPNLILRIKKLGIII